MKDGKLLLIDTTQDELLVALIDKDTIQTRTSMEQRRHSEMLNTVVGDWLNMADAFAVVTIGNSWTGTRVGATAVKAWAMASGKPIIELDKPCFDTARLKFKSGDFTDIYALQPKYNAEFKVTL